MNQPNENGTLLGHPKGLFVLFTTELWERFNYYGMRALLTLYMTKKLGFADDAASLTYGAANGLLYATPLIGGMIADRLLGYRRAITIGGILMAIGEIVITFMGFGLLPENVTTFYVGMAMIIVGNGFFKPNISTMVGTLYAQGDPRRDSAFTIFYMGINIGALSPFLCGWIGETYGYHLGFGLAGVGMLLGLISFLAFRRHLGDRGLPPQSATVGAPSRSLMARTLLVLIGVVACIPLLAYLVSKPGFVAKGVAPIAGGIFILYILWESLRGTRAERQGILVIVILSLFSVMFWAFFEQAGTSMTLFTDRHVDRTVLGWEIQTSMFQAVNPLFIILLAPFFSVLWMKLGRTGKNPSSALKFSLALFQMGLGFGVLLLAAKQVSSGVQASLILLLLTYLLHTTGELCLSPVGLSMVTKMAPVRLAGLLMGMWFLSNAFAHILGGVLAARSATWGFEKLYTVIAISATSAGVVLLLLYPIIKRWENDRLASYDQLKA
jgi:POT family proton-dependent oligopeptide transporter